MKIGIFYGSTMGTTEALSAQIATSFDVSAADIHDVSGVSVDKVTAYDLVLLGSSTWGEGELQDDWYDFIDQLKVKDLTGKKIGLFGCGDAASYEDTFCDALSIIHDAIVRSGCEFVGAYKPTNYTYTDLPIHRDGKFIGLAIDDANDSDLTEGRLEVWVSAIKSQL